MEDDNPQRPPLELETKLKAYKERGELVEPRVLFSAGIPQCCQMTKGISYGKIPLYDDMTQKDIIEIFSREKKV